MKETHTGTIADYLAAAAGIPHPWRASHYRIDEVAAMVHVWITRQPKPNVEIKRGWFDLPWFGQPGLPFSNRLSRQVFACLTEGMEISAICEIMNIPFADLWRFKHALDNGQVKFEYTSAKKASPAAADSAASPSSSPANAGNVPDLDDPIWERIITGELNIQIKTLSLQLILTKLRQQVSLQQNDEVKRLKLRELHKYVERNQRSLDYELHQIKELSQTESA